MIAALFVAPNGPYVGLPNVDAWSAERDARKYKGPHRAVMHPDCARWGRYAKGGPSAKVPRIPGNDDGCFAHALFIARTFGGVIEHPEASLAFKWFKLPIPKWRGGWTDPDEFGGRSCCVAQGHYGHRARKMTWLYAVVDSYPELIWGPSKSGIRDLVGYHSKEERARAIKTGVCQRLSKRQRILTPRPFRDLLISIVEAA